MKINNKEFEKLSKEIIRQTIWFAIILFLLDIYVFFFVSNEYLRSLFNFASEKTPATWVSSILLLLIGFYFFILYKLKDNKKWIYSGYFFLYLSLDDASYIHEQVSSLINEKVNYISYLPSYGWLYSIAPILITLISIILFNLFKEMNKLKLTTKYLFTSFLLLATSIIFDFIDGIFGDTTLNYYNTHFLRISEELLEITAFALILYSVSLLIINTKKVKYEKKI